MLVLSINETQLYASKHTNEVDNWDNFGFAIDWDHSGINLYHNISHARAVFLLSYKIKSKLPL